MIAEVTFKDGSKCLMELIYNWDRCHIYRTDTCYLIVPYQDVVHSRVSVEEFARTEKEAKARKKERQWKEVDAT